MLPVQMPRRRMSEPAKTKLLVACHARDGVARMPGIVGNDIDDLL